MVEEWSLPTSPGDVDSVEDFRQVLVALLKALCITYCDIIEQAGTDVAATAVAAAATQAASSAVALREAATEHGTMDGRGAGDHVAGSALAMATSRCRSLVGRRRPPQLLRVRAFRKF